MTNTHQNDLSRITYQLGRLNNEEFLAWITNEFAGKVTFSTSFSFEDQVITHQLLSQELPVKIFTLDTGRLFTETYSVWNSTNERYNTRVKAYYPNDQLLQEFVAEKAPIHFTNQWKTGKVAALSAR